MRSEENPLDLNNLPEDYTKDGKQGLEDSSSYAGYRKKKSGAKDGKDESGKVYECRFCSLKFCKSQALGGHMNRHRQERETETLNRARQLVFNNDPLLGQGAPHQLGGQPIPHVGYHQTGNINDPTLPFRSVYPTTRLFPGSSTTLLPSQGQPSPQQSPYMYSSPSRLVPFPSQYATQYPSTNDYFVGHVVPGNTHANNQPENNYTCIGAPVVGHGFSTRGNNNYGSSNRGGGGTEGGVGVGSGSRDVSLYNHDEGLNWGRSCTAGGTHKRLDPSSINRFQDGF